MSFRARWHSVVLRLLALVILLLLTLTPYVIEDLADLRRVADRALREREEFLERWSALAGEALPRLEAETRSSRGILEQINQATRELDDTEAQLRAIRAGTTGGTRLEPVRPPPPNPG